MESDFLIRLEGTTLNIYLGFELSTATSPELQKMLNRFIGMDIKMIVFDATDLVFVSSSGIRVIIYASQKIGNHPILKMLNCAKEIYETLELTGIHKFFNFVEDGRKNAKAPGNEENSEWQEDLAEKKQKMLDQFAANNDVVMYQMKIGGGEL